MDNILLSRSAIFNKVFNTIICILPLFITWLLISTSTDANIGITLCFLVLWPVYLYIVYFTFSMQHPVYFSGKGITFNASKGEQLILFTQMQSIKVTSPRMGTICRLVYLNEKGEQITIRWLTNPYADYNAIEELIRITKPEFYINGVHPGDFTWF